MCTKQTLHGRDMDIVGNNPFEKSLKSIPANFFSVKCVRFFVSTESEFPKIYRRLPKILEDFRRLPKVSDDFQP